MKKLPAMRQRTLKNTIRAAGVGLHSGEKIFLTVRPAPVDTGIVFKRTDLQPPVEIPARALAVGETVMSSTLVQDGIKVATVEHLMSAMAGLGVDNALVEVSAQEIPIMDGSAGPFVFLLQSAGMVEQAALKRFVRIKKPIRVSEGDKWAQLLPYEGFRVSFTIEFDHPVFTEETKSAEIEFSTASYILEIARARTFGFMKDIEYLRSKNLALGGSVDNAIVVDEQGVVNAEGLRFEDEFVRHKILDAIGDLYLLGYPLLAHFEAYKSGHALNNALIRALLQQPDCWEIATFPGTDAAVAYVGAEPRVRAA